MRLIGAGFGRSGTMSIHSALETLGYGPCYHMKITLKRYHHMRFFLQAWKGKKVNWKKFYKRYQSAVDWPTCSFYKELMQEFPEAKVLLNVRNPEKWYDSMKETIWAIQPAFPWWFPQIVRRMHDEIIWGGNLKGVFEDRDKAIALYTDYIKEVKNAVPGHRLLVYDVNEGWEPLCAFLEVPVPAGKHFPHLNDRNKFKNLIFLLRMLNWLLPLLLIILVTVLLFN